MSVVAARKYDSYLEFAADSIRVIGNLKDGQRVAGHETGKLFRQSDLVIGGVGYTRENTFMYLFSKTRTPSSATTEGILEFICDFYDWARKKIHNFEPYNNYLIGFENELFRVSDSYLVDSINEFAAIGAGMDFALAAMYLEQSPTKAVGIANELCVYCSEPLHTMVLHKNV